MNKETRLLKVKTNHNRNSLNKNEETRSYAFRDTYKIIFCHAFSYYEILITSVFPLVPNIHLTTIVPFPFCLLSFSFLIDDRKNHGRNITGYEFSLNASFLLFAVVTRVHDFELSSNEASEYLNAFETPK